MSDPSSSDSPTVVLVHGAFADGSSWNGVIDRLHARDVHITAPANPLRGISVDSSYTASVFEQTPGPVLAVGHSYGGAVITNAAARVDNVVGLVYVAAFAPDEGERLGDATATSKDAVLSSALVPRHYPSGDDGEPLVEFMIDPARVHDVFAADLPEDLAALPVPRNARSPSWRSPSLPERRLGRIGRRGPLSPCPTRRPAPTSSDRWPNGQARRSRKSRART
jgi:pimeloyl-ACP methyl ester carboxylesterase